MLSFRDFGELVVNRVGEFLPEDYDNASVETKDIVKNNDTVLTAVLIRKAGEVVTPTIYLNSFFNMYGEGVDLEKILEQIADARIAHDGDIGDFSIENITSFERCAGSIVPRLVNFDMNVSCLADRPYTEYLDLAVVYYINVDVADDNAVASIPITNSLMHQWGLTLDMLHKCAINNIASSKPFLKSMFEMISKDIFNSLVDEYGSEEEAREVLAGMFPDDDTMYVISNEKKVSGAAVILDKEFMTDVEASLGDEFYILPSSIHELILVRDTVGMDANSLRDMVREVNSTQVASDEVLSNSVYHYSKGIISVA